MLAQAALYQKYINPKLLILFTFMHLPHNHAHPFVSSLRHQEKGVSPMKTALRGGFLLPAQFWVFPQFPGFSLLACAKFVPEIEPEPIQRKRPILRGQAHAARAFGMNSSIRSEKDAALTTVGSRNSIAPL